MTRLASLVNPKAHDHVVMSIPVAANCSREEYAILSLGWLDEARETHQFLVNPPLPPAPGVISSMLGEKRHNVELR